MQYLKNHTSVSVKIGPFVDDTDGKTAETGLTIAQADVRLAMNGGNMVQKTEISTCTHDELGVYFCNLNETDTTHPGSLQLYVHKSGALPVWHDYTVLHDTVYDVVFSHERLEVDLLELKGDAQSATDLKAFADSGYDPASNRVQGVLQVETVIALSGHTAQTGDSFARLGTPASWCIAADLLAIDNFVDDLESRLTAARAGYLDNLSAGAVALASICTEARLAELAAANLPADVDAIKAETDNLPSGVPKNVALSNFSFLMTDSTDNTPKTGLTVTVQVSKDGGAFANATNTPATEIGNGAYKIDITQTEMNADILLFKATAASANQTTIVLVTST